MSKKLILIIGAPGAGKTTDSRLIAQRHNGDITAFSIGEILREEVKNGTAIGKIAQKYMQKGELVPSEVIMYEIFGKIKKAPTNIVLVDGLPRGLNQMRALGDTLHNDKEVKLVAVIEIRVKEETARKRVLGDNPTQEEIELFEPLSLSHTKTMLQQHHNNILQALKTLYLLLKLHGLIIVEKLLHIHY